MCTVREAFHGHCPSGNHLFVAPLHQQPVFVQEGLPSQHDAARDMHAMVLHALTNCKPKERTKTSITSTIKIYATQRSGTQAAEDQKLNYGLETLQGLFATWTNALAKQQSGYQEAPDPDPDQDTDGCEPGNLEACLLPAPAVSASNVFALFLFISPHKCTYAAVFSRPAVAVMPSH